MCRWNFKFRKNGSTCRFLWWLWGSLNLPFCNWYMQNSWGVFASQFVIGLSIWQDSSEEANLENPEPKKDKKKKNKNKKEKKKNNKKKKVAFLLLLFIFANHNFLPCISLLTDQMRNLYCCRWWRIMSVHWKGLKRRSNYDQD